MSYANFDEICQICCEYCNDHLDAPLEPTERYLARFRRAESIPYPSHIRESRRGTNRMVPDQEEAIYVIRYGQYV